jgi:nicotinate-nucleotide adenylyltransferase
LRVAIFGGSFDPIHKAHLAVAAAARDAFQLDRILVVPAANPPHKQGREMEDWTHRYRMVQLACTGERGLEASDLESGQQKSYSIQTIDRVRAGLAETDSLFFIIGADAFAEIGTWYRQDDVIARVEFIVVKRPGHGYDAPPGAVVHRLDTVQMPVSSSAIRQKLALCEPPEELPPLVFEYIRQYKLYGYGSACQG